MPRLSGELTHINRITSFQIFMQLFKLQLSILFVNYLEQSKPVPLKSLPASSAEVVVDAGKKNN
jgi:hypothetical protein